MAVTEHTDDPLRQRLEAAGVAPTRQRLDIARVLFSRDQHLSADQLLERLRELGHGHVSKATVYNTLGLFARKGLVREVFADPCRVFYDSNTGYHHHVFDVERGTLTDIDADALAVDGLAGLGERLGADLQLEGVDIVVRVRPAHR
jgi:Fur family iron response transcriptional regulator